MQLKNYEVMHESILYSLCGKLYYVLILLSLEIENVKVGGTEL